MCKGLNSDYRKKLQEVIAGSWSHPLEGKMSIGTEQVSSKTWCLSGVHLGNPQVGAKARWKTFWGSVCMVNSIQFLKG